ncbi:MAG: molybdopterin oxidoreductase family protein [Armatimonadota bacterium]
MTGKPTTCGFCGCGCAFYVQTNGSQIAAVAPSQNHPVTSGRLCIKGWYGPHSLLNSNRLRTPLVRTGDQQIPTSWDEAVGAVASAVRDVLSRRGPRAVGVIGSARLTNEECYLLSRFARAVIGTPNLDSSCRFYDASLIPGLLQTVGTPASQVQIPDLPKAGSMLIVGANVTEQLPQIGSRIAEAARNGCKVVVVDPRTSRLSAFAEFFVRPRPGTDLHLFKALLKTILIRDMYPDSSRQLSGFEQLSRSLEKVSIDRVEEICGVSVETISEMAEMLAENPPTVVMFGSGVLQQANSTELVKALADLAVLLGGAVMPLRGHNNAQGACDMGAVKDMLPGYMPLSEESSRRKWEAVWNCRIPADGGMSALEMLNACRSGDIEALLIFGENLALSAPNTEASMDALRSVKFLAVSDLYLTETAGMANVVFPACSFLEKDGTFTNVEGRVQRVRKVVPPAAESKSDMEIIADIAKALGAELPRDPQAVMDEITKNVPQYSGVSYARFDEEWGQPWPRNRAVPRLSALNSSEEDSKQRYMFRLISSHVNFPHRTGSMSRMIHILAREYPEPYAELNPADAEEMGLRSGSRVRIFSETGSLVRQVILSDAVPPGCVHVPYFFGTNTPNALASYECDPESGTPVYKACAVELEAVE